jgi:hypothetical protein
MLHLDLQNAETAGVPLIIATPPVQAKVSTLTFSPDV